MDPLTVALFVKYKRNKAGKELTDGNGNVVKDVFGNIVVSDGKWNDTKNVDQLLSAVGAIHAARGQRGPYEDCCNECIELDKVGTYHGCRFHRGSPQIWRKGNPKDCSLIENLVNQNAKDGSDYKSKGDSPLTPWELLDIRQKLLSTNNL